MHPVLSKTYPTQLELPTPPYTSVMTAATCHSGAQRHTGVSDACWALNATLWPHKQRVYPVGLRPHMQRGEQGQGRDSKWLGDDPSGRPKSGRISGLSRWAFSDKFGPP